MPEIDFSQCFPARFFSLPSVRCCTKKMSTNWNKVSLLRQISVNQQKMLIELQMNYKRQPEVVHGRTKIEWSARIFSHAVYFPPNNHSSVQSHELAFFKSWISQFFLKTIWSKLEDGEVQKIVFNIYWNKKDSVSNFHWIQVRSVSSHLSHSTTYFIFRKSQTICRLSKLFRNSNEQVLLGEKKIGDEAQKSTGSKRRGKEPFCFMSSRHHVSWMHY